MMDDPPSIKFFTFFYKEKDLIKKSCLCLVTAFFQTKVYLFAADSILVPSIKMVFPEISPREYKSCDSSASVFFEHCAKCRERNRAKVA